jgi:hypothetical protein
VSRFFNSEVASGLLVIAFGVLGLAAIGALDMGTASDMGPGYLPRLVAWALILAGGAMTGLAILRSHPPVPDLHLRPLLAISAAVVVFGAAIDRFGMVAAVVGMTVLASLASPISRWRETPIIAACLAAGAVLVFIVGLKLAIPIWPR